MFSSKLKAQSKNLCSSGIRNPLSKKGQSTLEYAVLIAVMVAAIAVMSTYVQRGVRANLKTVEQQINMEFAANPGGPGGSGGGGDGSSGSYTPPSDIHITEIAPNNKRYWLNFAPHEIKYYKFTAGIAAHPTDPTNYNAGIGATTAPSDINGVNTHILVKRGSVPTLDDFNLTWDLAPTHWYDGHWGPEESASKAPDLFWNYNVGVSGQLIEIREPMEEQDYYVMLYNDSDEYVTGQAFNVGATGYIY